MEITYQNRLVAFLDVMGFQELLKESKPEKLSKYFQQVRKSFEEKSGTFHGITEEHNFQKILFSDSIILSIELCKDFEEDLAATAQFFHSISRLQYDLAVKCDVWTRGGVSFGKLHIDERTNEMAGPAFVSAYSLEKFANYPRIVIDPKVCAYFKLSPVDFVKRINDCQYQGSLVEMHERQRIGRATPMEVDGIQIDWFAHTFQDSTDLSVFFDGITNRFVSDQQLFVKCRRLCRYLRESYDLWPKDGDQNPRLKLIDENLKKLNF